MWTFLLHKKLYVLHTILCMNLNFSDLKKREVINTTDGSSMGKPCDVVISFPMATMQGIVVPGKGNWFTRLFSKNDIYIDKSSINKIGADVILVTLNCGDTCSQYTKVSKPISPCDPCNPCEKTISPCNNNINDNQSYIDE